MVLENIPVWAVNVLKVIAVVTGFYILGRFVIKPLIRWSLKSKGETLASPVSRISHYITIVVGIAVGLTAGGYGNVLTTFGTVIAAGTLAIGFAMQKTIGATVSGFFLLIDRPFEVGDWIEWNGNKGRVKDIRLRTTTVMTFNNELLTVPNNELTENTIKNPVSGKRLRVQIDIGIGYEDSIDQAKEIIEEIMRDIDPVSDDPGPDVKLVGLGDSTVDLKARYWIMKPRRADFVSTKDEFLQRVKQRFEEEDIDMPYPTQTIAGDSIKLEEG